MNMIEKAKLWWKTTPVTTKIFACLGLTTAVVGTCAAVSAVRNSKKPDAESTTPAVEAGNDKPETAPADSNEWVFDENRPDWEVWNPAWEDKYKSKSGWEDDRLADALEILVRMDGMMKNDGYCEDDDVHEAMARVQDLARQFAYLNQHNQGDEFRERFPYLKNDVEDIYTNVSLKSKEAAEETKGE